jgi:hypothetical protein
VAAQPKQPEPAKKKPPMQLSARSIETWVDRTPTRSQLKKAVCTGRVVVHQDPDPNNKDQKRGTDITAHRLDVDQYEAGNVMTVTATPGEYALVQFDKLSVLGPEVFIDQRNNLATVKGRGSMLMPAATDLQGADLKDPADVTVYWTDGMEFRGAEKTVVYDGNVQAIQKESRVLCQTMQVTLDRAVWLNPASDPDKKKGGPGGSTAAKIDNVLCDMHPRLPPADGAANAPLSPVVYIEKNRDERNRVVRQQLLTAREMHFDNLESKLKAAGPGEVRIWQLGAKDMAGPRPQQQPTAKAQPKGGSADEEMKLTRVVFKGRMSAVSQKNKKQTATFYDDVEVINLPADKPEMAIDAAKLPAGAIRLVCDKEMYVISHPPAGGAKGYQ